MSAQGYVSAGQASSHEDELELIAEIQDPMLKERFLHMMMMKARCNESPGVVAAMIQAAEHQDPHVRTAAVELLSESNIVGEVTDVLAKALEDEDPSVRLHALKGLKNVCARQENEKVASKILSLSQDRVPTIREMVQEVILARIDSFTTSMRCSMLENELESIRIAAVRSFELEDRADSRVMEGLQHALVDGHPVVRMNAIHVIARKLQGSSLETVKGHNTNSRSIALKKSSLEDESEDLKVKEHYMKLLIRALRDECDDVVLSVLDHLDFDSVKQSRGPVRSAIDLFAHKSSAVRRKSISWIISAVKQTLSSSQDWAYDLVLGILKNPDTKNTDELDSAAEEVLD
uniref:Condensin complex subunit 1 C-terminal domain-containing protein n=1 Tax=Guillardia theta TaxID=55529 RepID=A0A6U6DAP9_GUITH|mmetsp:Transcript_52454/g.162814  ORF Transcript_52454/g.162814 Transcript_52454/m.162814 type:complete len:347 (+) Transcript_52454:19-1059(+)